MPHFIVDCSVNILSNVSKSEILKAVHDSTYASGLFLKEEIKVRVNQYNEFSVGGSKTDFIHVFGYILEGRTGEQKANLSKDVVKVLTVICPTIQFIAMSVDEFAIAGYCNRRMV
jgi:5-carboxymethyl-2-hydroxymuconate isomerase